MLARTRTHLHALRPPCRCHDLLVPLCSARVRPLCERFDRGDYSALSIRDEPLKRLYIRPCTSLDDDLATTPTPSDTAYFTRLL